MVAPHDAALPEDDPMGPPKIPVEVECIHCGNTYMSDQIRWQPDPQGPDGGWWVCPIEGCDGAGFCFDIYPTDPEVARQFGVHMWSDDDEGDFDDDFSEDMDNPPPSSDLPPRQSRFGEDDIPF
jgi:hypothetical protein